MAYKKAHILKAIEGSNGYKSVIAARVGCAIRTVYNLAERWPDVQAAIDREREKQGDYVESQLQKRIAEGSDACIIFYCKTMLRNRGYEQYMRQDIAHSDKPQPKREWVIVDPKKRKPKQPATNGKAKAKVKA